MQLYKVCYYITTLYNCINYIVIKPMYLHVISILLVDLFVIVTRCDITLRYSSIILYLY